MSKIELEVDDNVVYEHPVEIKPDEFIKEHITVDILKVKSLVWVEPGKPEFLDENNIFRKQYRIKHIVKDGKFIDPGLYNVDFIAEDNLKIQKGEKVDG